MPFIGYARLGEIVNKSEDQVREDKENGIIDLDDFDSLVKYVAEYWGWGPLAKATAEVNSLRERLSEMEDQIVALRKGAPRVEPPKQLGAEDLPHDTVRWKVEDRSEKSKHTDDPYLRRTLERKKGNIT